MYNGEKQNYLHETPPTQGPGGVSEFDNNANLLNEETDKREVAQHKAQDELSQALHDRQSQAHRAGTIPNIKEHTARISVTPVNETPTNNITTSPFIIDKITGDKNHPGETVHSAGHSVDVHAITSSPMHDKKLATVPEYEQPQQVEKEGYTPHPKLRTLRTFKSDLAQAAGQNNESVASIALAAHKRKEKEQMEQPVEKPAVQKIPVRPVSAIQKPKIQSYRPSPIHYVEQKKEPEPIRATPQITYTTNAQQRPMAPSSLPKMPPPKAPAPIMNTGSMRASSYIQQVDSIPVSSAKTVPFFKNVFFLIISIALVGVGGFGLYSVFIANKVQNTEIDITQPTAMIHYDTFSEITFTSRDVFMSAIKNGASLLPQASQSVWYAHTPQVAVDSLLTTIAPRIPDVFARNTKEPFALGYYRNTNGEPRFYMTITFSTFGQAFSGALKWEDTLYQDIESILMQELDGSLYGYVDAIIGNKDVRKLVNTNGTPFIVYGFIDQNTFVLTEDDATFVAISNNIFAHRSTR